MDIKDKITQTLIGITAQLQEISSEFYIIGASAMILSNIKIGETSDIVFWQLKWMHLSCNLTESVYGGFPWNQRECLFHSILPDLIFL